MHSTDELGIYWRTLQLSITWGEDESWGRKWKVLEKYNGKVLVWGWPWVPALGLVLKALTHGISWQRFMLPPLPIKNQERMWSSEDHLEVRFRQRHPSGHACVIFSVWWHSLRSQPPLVHLAVIRDFRRYGKEQSDQSASVPRERSYAHLTANTAWAARTAHHVILLPGRCPSAAQNVFQRLMGCLRT